MSDGGMDLGWSVVFNTTSLAGGPFSNSTKVSSSDIQNLITALNSLNSHLHYATGVSGASTSNPSVTTVGEVSTQEKHSVFSFVEFRAALEKLAVIDSTNHSHYFPNFSGINSWGDFGYASLITPSPVPVSWASTIATNRKLKYADIVELRNALSVLNGHSHWTCTCNCNYSPCHGHCGTHCPCFCMGVGFGH